MADMQRLKMQAAEAALDRVEDGMRLGIGTGSTAEAFIRLLAKRVGAGLDIVGVTTSERSEALCRELGISTATLEAVPQLDLTVDGADELDAKLRLIKGGGGALLREKIVATASDRMLVIADASKKVDVLGDFPLPIEINGFGLMATFLAIQKAVQAMDLAPDMTLRRVGEEPFITDSGHLILDASFGRIPDPEALSAALLAVPGVVEHGLFLGLASAAILASEDGVAILKP